MAKYPTTRLVFDRKHLADNIKTKGLIQIEVLLQGKRKFFSTGVKVLKNQYSTKVGVCNCFEMQTLNQRVAAVKQRIDEYINRLIENGVPFDFDELDRYMKQSDEGTKKFIDFVADRIENRQDIAETTRKTHRKLRYVLERFGRIIFFNDLTKQNIMLFDDFLHRTGNRQTTIYTYHKLMKTYIHDAMRRELIDRDPYQGLSFKRGETRPELYLSEEEFLRIKNAPMPTRSIDRVRDLFVMQCLTGLAYSDLMAFDFSQVEKIKGKPTLVSTRQKTGVEYYTMLSPDAMKIIEKYGGSLPQMTNQQYNMRLKMVADAAGIDKPISSHYGRRTCGMLLLNRGVPIEVVSKILGHTSIRTTQMAYAKVLKTSVVDQMAKAFDDMQKE